MKNQFSPIKYFAYVRKSSEDKERQAISIPAQKDRIQEQFKDFDIEFIEEERSAFIPYNRPRFLEMLERVEKGEHHGIIAWHPDRLSRNEIDAGKITYSIRSQVIKDLKFCTYHFENTPEGIWMLQIALSQSQYESAKKGRDVNRGLVKKAQMGIYPAPAPTGYINDKFAERGNKKVLPDPERFRPVRKMFDLMLAGTYTVPQLLKIVNEKWKFKMPNGKSMARNTLYQIFTNPFYYGWFQYPINSKYEPGKWHKGIHKPMITEQEYDKIQELLGRKGRPRPKSHVFKYTGLMRCRECGCMITAEKKVKRQKNGNVHRYVYYHCTKKKNPDCTQGCIEEKALEDQIISALVTLEIPTEFNGFALKWLRKRTEKDVEGKKIIVKGQQKELGEINEKIEGLIDMRAAGEISREQFSQKMATLEKEKIKLEENLRSDGSDDCSWERTKMVLTFAEKARTKFQKGSSETKKQIFATLGSNLFLKDKKLNIYWENWLLPMKIVSKRVRWIHRRFEPLEKPINTRILERCYLRDPRLRGHWTKLEPV
ncbi:recombinase family protein [Acidobacteria bacterium AH-259-G07]|nr:recombinase family protein [Acidobacteria bacterium AH-259-G07]